MNIGQQIHMRRRELGLTITELAKITDISRNYISLIESDAVNPTVVTLNTLAKALDCNISLNLIRATPRLSQEEYTKIRRGYTGDG